MKILGIESSCDETAVAVYDNQAGLLAHDLYSQIKTHAVFGGVVPELASRDHIKKALPLIRTVLESASLDLQSLDGIAYTKGPGLIGALMVGASLAKALSFSLNIPAIGVHHMEAHIMATMLEENPPPFPFVSLLVSGGHTLLLNVKAFGEYECLGESLDDAVGEAFDKTAKLLDLPYPGGPSISKLAEQGNSARFHFPRPMTNRPGLDFSFSGLKTFARNSAADHELDAQTRADIACAFEDAIVDTLIIKAKRALKQTDLKTLVVAGGVSANKKLRKELSLAISKIGGKVYYPALSFCTDNAAMVAYTGMQYLLKGYKEDLAIDVKPRWGLGIRA